MTPYLTASLFLLAVVYASAAASSFPSLTLAEACALPLEVKLRLLHERGLGCEDCSEEEVGQELFQWQQLPVKSKSQSRSRSQSKGESRGVRDEANVAEVLESMRRGGFGLPSSFVNPPSAPSAPSAGTAAAADTAAARRRSKAQRRSKK